MSIDPILHIDKSPYNTFDDNPIIVSDPSGGNGEITVKQNTAESPGDKLVLHNTVYLFNADKAHVTDEQMATLAEELKKQVSEIGASQRFNNVIAPDMSPMNLKVSASVDVVIVSSEEEALALAQGGVKGNVFGVEQKGTSYVESSGEGNGWKGTFTLESTYGGNNYAHEWMHLFGLGDRYILGLTKASPFSPGDFSTQSLLAANVPGDPNYFAKDGNLMVNSYSSSLSKGQISFLYSFSDEGMIIPATSGTDFTGYKGVLIGKITESMLTRTISTDMMEKMNYYGPDFKTKRGKEAYNNLPAERQQAIDNYIGD
jgi:hypothetical protein